MVEVVVDEVYGMEVCIVEIVVDEVVGLEFNFVDVKFLKVVVIEMFIFDRCCCIDGLF